MTEYELQTVRRPRSRDERSGSLVPVLAALIVLVLGLVVVGITSGDGNGDQNQVAEPFVVELTAPTDGSTQVVGRACCEKLPSS
jgi:hypothetical protein